MLACERRLNCPKTPVPKLCTTSSPKTSCISTIYSLVRAMATISTYLSSGMISVDMSLTHLRHMKQLNMQQKPCVVGKEPLPHPVTGYQIGDCISSTNLFPACQQKLAVAYLPWHNGTFKHRKGYILEALPSLLAELKLGPQVWPSIITIIPTILNEEPEKRLWKNAYGSTRSPLQVINGISSWRLLVQVMKEQEQVRAPIELARADTERLYIRHRLQESLHLIQKELQKLVDARRQRAVQSCSRISCW